MFLGEKSVEAMLKQGLVDIVEDETLLPMMLDSLSENQRASALQWFRENAERNITVSPSFPRTAPQFPMLAVLPGGMSESDETIGGIGDQRRLEDGSAVSIEGVFFDSQIRTLVLSPNADACSWLAAFAVFTLVRYRDFFSGLGLINQSISVSDMNAAEEFQPDLVFTRAATLSGRHFVGFPRPIAPNPPTVALETTWTAQAVEAQETITFTVRVEDTFTRTDATVLNNAETGQPWAALAGTWGVSGGKGYCSASEANDRDSAVIDTGSGDCTVQATFSTLATGQRLVFRGLDRDNYLAVEATATQWRIRRRELAGWTTLQSFTVTPVSGDIVKVVLSAQAIRLYVNGTFIGSVNEYFQRTATKHGIGIATGATAARFDSFRVN